MQEVLTRAGCFIAIIFIGYLLRRRGFFQPSDFHILSKIVIKLTLPAAIIYSFSSSQIDSSHLLIALLGFGGGVIYVLLGFFLSKGKTPLEKGFAILNLSGYNIGNFTLPFAQSFLGNIGVVTTSLFDTGNAFVCMGGSYGIASMVAGGNRRHLLLRIVKTLLTSVPFDTYLIMIVLCLAHLSLPTPVISLAEIISNGNAFLAMLMIGVGFQLSGEKSQRTLIVKILVVRFTVAALLAACFYFLLPLGLEYRQALAVLCFSPIASINPAFTAELKGDVGLASALNSLSIVISIICIVTLLTLMA